MLQIGLTGGIGSGKTTVAQIFRVLGIPVFDADAVAKQLIESDKDIREGLLQLFGSRSFVNETLDRKYMAAEVFADRDKLEQLNALVHPHAIAASQNWARQQSSPYIVKEAALLFEAGSTADLDYIVGVFAPDPLRLKRAMHRDGADRSNILQRMNHQISETIKMRLCDVVVRNDEQSLLIPQVLALHERFLGEANNSKLSL